MSKLLVITNGNYFSRLILEKLVKTRQQEIAGIFLIDGDYKGKTGWRSLFFVGLKTCFPFLFAKCLQIAMFRISASIFPKALLNVEKLAKDNNIKLFHFTSISEDNAFEKAEQLKPGLIISVSCPQRIPNRVLECAALGGINIHSSLLPRYAGLAPYYWVLSKGEKLTGTTVHRIEHNFDEGNIIVQKKIAIPERSSSLELFEMLARIGSHILLEAVEKIENGINGDSQDITQKTYFSHPDLRSYLNLKQNGFKILRIQHLVSLIKGEIRLFRENLKSKQNKQNGGKLKP